MTLLQMPKLISDNINNEKADFSYIKKNGFFSDPINAKKIAIRNAMGSSYLEGINLPEHFFLVSYELEDNKRS
jgi:hypothetical protein